MLSVCSCTWGPRGPPSLLRSTTMGVCPRHRDSLHPALLHFAPPFPPKLACLAWHMRQDPASRREAILDIQRGSHCALRCRLCPKPGNGGRRSLSLFAHLMRRTDLLMLGKIEGRRRRGRQRMTWWDGITDSMDMSLRKL